MDRLVFVHLYPRELGINGDVGNMLALARRCEWRDIPVQMHSYHPGDDLPEHVDLLHIGSGPLSGQRAVYSDLLRISASLRELAESGVPLLAVAGGWQLLGRELITPEGERLPGADVFPTRTTLTSTRTVGEMVIDGDSGVLAGFENHSGSTVLDDDANPLGRVLAGGGNAPQEDSGERFEGVRIGARIGTHLHGPVLPMNPALADELLSAALARHGETGPVSASIERDTVDDWARRSRDAIAARLRIRTPRP